ncbi:DUF4232 domain-containing protein [Peterkaempfera sp. SMS 1(5)a]|uniref:DUF4232 domain-containing protein n=1 Tax=Peterkaempfera podocarpi TaxID=3232308 RepID=UPI003672469B
MNEESDADVAIHQPTQKGRHHRRAAECARRTGPGGFPLLVGGAVLIAVLSGCGSGVSGSSGGVTGTPQTLPGSAGPASGDPTTPATTPAAATPTASADTPESAPPASAGTPASTAGSSTGGTNAGGSSRCHTGDLRASIGSNDPGAGQENFPIVLTNRSSRTCTVYGFPGVAFVNSAGEQVTVDPERSTGQQKQRVTLAPGQSAWSPMSFANPGITGVTTVTPAAVLITPPDETTSLRVRWTGGEVSNTGKASVPRLGPFQPGSGV